MFASTHPQEFPPAILSRLQRFDVRRLTVAEISGKLERILAADGREAEPEAVELIARLAAGGMRDAESMLDQLLAVDEWPRRGRARSATCSASPTRRPSTGSSTALAAGDAARRHRPARRARGPRPRPARVPRPGRRRHPRSPAGGPDLRDRRRSRALIAAAHRLARHRPDAPGSGGLRLQLELALLDADRRWPHRCASRAPPRRRDPAPATPRHGRTAGRGAHRRRDAAATAEPPVPAATRGPDRSPSRPSLRPRAPRRRGRRTAEPARPKPPPAPAEARRVRRPGPGRDPRARRAGVPRAATSSDCAAAGPRSSRP